MILGDWLKALLIEGEVLLPLDASKLFRHVLSVIYGYEKMRYWWVWERRDMGEDKYMLFMNRKQRRVKR